jgi:sec-independent protein translocase protein TatC
VKVLMKHNISPRLVTDEVGEGFMVFIKISMITAAAFAAPWVVYQIWKFVAAGLYPHERKYITRYLPLSITLLITGMLFVYYLILPWTLDFLIGFSTSFELPIPASTAVASGSPPNVLQAPVIAGDPDPATLRDGSIWINSVDQRLMIFWKGQARQIAFNSDKLIAPEIKLEKYIDLVVTMLVIFGVSFQLPLVVLALERVGIVSIQGLKEVRRYVYMGLAVAAAVITPGGDIPTMLGLTIPLIGLYELGIWLAQFGRKRAAA